MKSRVVRIATIILALVLVGALTLTAFATGVESVISSDYGAPSEYKLSATNYTYNGKAKCPTVTVTNTEGAVIEPTNYTVTYKNNIKPGKAIAKVIFNNGLVKITDFD